MGYRVMAFLIMSVHGLVLPLAVLSIIATSELGHRSTGPALMSTIPPNSTASISRLTQDPSPQPAGLSAARAQKPTPSEWIAVAHIRRGNLETLIYELIAGRLDMEIRAIDGEMVVQASQNNEEITAKGLILGEQIMGFGDVSSAQVPDRHSPEILDIAVTQRGRPGRLIIVIDDFGRNT